jgi:competence protein ComEA
MPDSPRTNTVERDAPNTEFWRPSLGPGQTSELPPRPSEWGGQLQRFVDRVRELRGDPRVGIAALLVVALAAGFIWYRLGAADSGQSSTTRRSPTTSAPTSPAPAADSTGAGSSAATGSSSGATKKGERATVHVAGAVAKPGVYDLDAGARVIDAIEAAGGGAPEADLNRLNLAAKVADGQRVLVQRVGEAAPAGSSSPGAAGGGGSADPSGLVSLNSATQPELEALPGIGPTLAEAIITERERRGGFRSVNELRDVRGIGEKRFADLKDKVTI